MKLLEELYLVKIQLPRNFKKRKVSLQLANSIVAGVKNSGKTFLIYELLDNIDTQKYLYIDLLDNRVNINKLINLEEFIIEKNIEILIVENFNNEFSLPSNTINIITTEKKIDIVDYLNIDVYPLDFEEFISFENSTHSIKHSFNDFLKNSTFPKYINLYNHEQAMSLQRDIKLISNSILEEEIFKMLINCMGLKLSLLQIFNKLKENIKVSKDKFYEIVKDLENRGYIFFVSKYNQLRSSKKIYIIDTYLKNSISFDKNFQFNYENFVFLQLIKNKKDVFYTDYLQFFIPNENRVIIAKAFLDIDEIDIKLEKLLKYLSDLSIKYLDVVTTSDDHETFDYKDIEVRVIPFWEWALI
jgi:predicted AAA+ superfamily ATPase